MIQVKYSNIRAIPFHREPVTAVRTAAPAHGLRGLGRKFLHQANGCPVLDASPKDEPANRPDMKTKLTLKLIAASLLLSTLNPQLSTCLAQGTSFTYQGRLNDAANPSGNGRYDFQFQVFDAPSLGSSYGSPNPNGFTAVPVSNGLFTVVLNFGAGVFTGADRWLQISARTNGASTFTPLPARQQLTPTPYAIYAGNAAQVGGQSASAFVAKAGDTMTGTLNLPANGLRVGANQLVASGGNVGIGTITPQAKLDIQGTVAINTNDIYLRAGTDSAHGLGYRSSVNGGAIGVDGPFLYGFNGGCLGLSGPDYAALTWDWHGNIWVSNNLSTATLNVRSDASVGGNATVAGNVGIGTTSPLAPLDVLGGNWDVGNTEGDFRIGNSTYRLKMGVANAGGGAGDVRIHAAGGTSRLMLGSGTVDVLTVISNKVGINNSSPATALDVVGGANNQSNGIVRVGIPGFYQIGLDFESVQARSGTNVSPLGLNLYGGDVNIGKNVMTVYDGGSSPGYVAVFGDLYSNGLTHSGNGSGTAEAPDKGLILRRIKSTTTAVGSVVARTDKLTLQRDGSNGGWRIVNLASPGHTTIAATGLNSGGGTVNFVTSIINTAGAGITPVFSDGQNVVSFRCSFGDFFGPGETTEVSLTRYPGDSFWTGTVTSTYNQ